MVVSLPIKLSRMLSYTKPVFILPWTGRPGWAKAKTPCNIASLDSTRRASAACNISSVGVVSAMCGGSVPVSNSFVEGVNLRLIRNWLITWLVAVTGSTGITGRETCRRPLRAR